MHIEVLVEDSSGAALVETLLPRIIGEQRKPHTWRVHRYKGVRRLRPDPQAGKHAGHRQLLDQLPRQTMFRLAVEEVEAWYLGDKEVVLAAYSKAKKDVIDRYVQDSVCGTWETLADSVHPGGSAKVHKEGWPRPGELKHEWAKKIGPQLNIDRNASPSFNKFVAGLRRLTRET